MKKFVLGLLIGFLLAAPAFAFAEQVSMVGKKVQTEYPVIVDGKELEVKAIAIDGTSYAPLRVIGQAVGYDVSFKDKTVIFTSKSEEGERMETQTPSVPTTTPEEQRREYQYTLENIDMAISGKESEINALLMGIGMAESVGQPQEKIDELKAQLTRTQQELERLRQIKAELEAQAQQQK